MNAIETAGTTYDEAQRNQIPPALRRFARSVGCDDIRRSHSGRGGRMWSITKDHSFPVWKVPEGFEVHRVYSNGSGKTEAYIFRE